MKQIKSLLSCRLVGSLALAGAFLSTTTTSKANVYATDIQISATLSSTNAVPIPENGTSTITYRLNQAATGGCTLTILDSNSNIVDTLAGTTSLGLNTVVWGTTNSSGQPVGPGTYSVSITAAATGFTVWTQISSDTAAGAPAHYPLGIDVDKNTNSPYYGRVVFGCALHTGTVNVPAAGMQTGLFKCNADGSQADEGWYGNANYLTDDGADTPVAGQMPDSGGYDPMMIRIGDDDRIYWVDNSDLGAIVACDMEATTNQLVICEGPNSPGFPGNPHNYSLNPDYSDLSAGFQEFDAIAQSPYAFTTNVLGGAYSGAIFLCDGDYPNWGIWMYHLVNGASDPNDTVGDQVVYAGSGSSLLLVSSGGVSVDTNLDIFSGQNRNNNGDVDNRAMVFSNWNAGILPAEGQGFGPALLTANWAVGASDNSFEEGRDIVLNSRSHPTILAIPMSNGATYTSGKTGAGIRLLNAADGSVVTVTNGSTVTTYTNLDVGEIYRAAAFDAVGNLYAASTQRNLWRAWSPPGPSTNTTLATETMAIGPAAATVTLGVSTFSGAASSNAAPITASYNGTGPVAVQWYYIDNSNDTNAVIGQVVTTGSTTTLTLTDVQDAQNGYQYFVVVANSLGTNSSSAATLSVINPTISITPTTFSVGASSNAPTVVATVNGTSPTVQWFYIDNSNDTNAVVGQVTSTATTSTLALTSVQLSQNGYRYFAVASWSYAPSVTSAVATLTVVAPTATLAATAFGGDANGNATNITATANGNSATYQWYSIDLNNDTTAVTGQTNLTLSLTDLTASQNGYKYFLVASWPYAPSVTTATATLTVYSTPVIGANISPSVYHVPVGTSLSYAFSVNGALPLTYQWYANGTNIPGATSSTYSFSAAQGTNVYYVNAANSVNPAGVTSSQATVTAPNTALSFSSTTGANSSIGWDLNAGAGGAPTFVSPGVLQLTTAAGSEARSAFYALSKLPINGFVASYTYTPSGGSTVRADGVTFCVQGESPTSVGADGGSLGVSTIKPSAEFEINLYTGAAGSTGISLNTNGGVGPNGPTGSVNVNSLQPISVTIMYNPATTNVSVTLEDTNGDYYVTNYTGNLANITNAIGGTTAYIGFTGGTGGDDAVQNISNFLFEGGTPILSAGALSGGNLPLSWTPASFSLLESPSVSGPWTPVTGVTLSTNLVSGQASTTVTPSGPAEFYEIVAP